MHSQLTCDPKAITRNHPRNTPHPPLGVEILRRSGNVCAGRVEVGAEGRGAVMARWRGRGGQGMPHITSRRGGMGGRGGDHVVMWSCGYAMWLVIISFFKFYEIHQRYEKFETALCVYINIIPFMII